MNLTRTRLLKSQERYKRNYDDRIRNQAALVNQGDYDFFWVERKSRKDHRHKLAPIAEGPYLVTKTDKNTVFIERSYRSVEKASRSRVVLAPKPKTKEEVYQTLRPEQLLVDIKLTAEATNLEDILGKVAATKQTNDKTEEHQPTNDAAFQNQKEESEDETEEFVIE